MPVLKLSVPESLSDEDLLRALPNDTAGRAFHELFNRYYTPLVTFASKLLDGVDEPYDQATDVVQNFFVSLYESGGACGASSVKSYFFTSVKNASLNVLKHRKIVRKYEEEAARESANVASDKADELIERSEADAKVAAALDKLPEQCRRIFLLSRFDNLTNQQIADMLKLSKRTVETQISNALKMLRKLLLSMSIAVLSLLISPNV